MESTFQKSALFSIETINKKQLDITKKIEDSHIQCENLNRNLKALKKNSDEIKTNIEEFHILYNDIEQISQEIGDCCEKINQIEKILTEKTMEKYLKEVQQYEDAQIARINGEEKSLRYKLYSVKLKELKLQMRDLQLKDSLASGPTKKPLQSISTINEIPVIHDNSALEDFLNS